MNIQLITKLLDAADSGNTAFVEKIGKRAKSNKHEREQMDWAFAVAAEEGNVVAVDALVPHVDVLAKQGRALKVAISKGQVEVVNRLLPLLDEHAFGSFFVYACGKSMNEQCALAMVAHNLQWATEGLHAAMGGRKALVVDAIAARASDNNLKAAIRVAVNEKWAEGVRVVAKHLGSTPAFFLTWEFEIGAASGDIEMVRALQPLTAFDNQSRVLERMVQQKKWALAEEICARMDRAAMDQALKGGRPTFESEGMAYIRQVRESEKLNMVLREETAGKHMDPSVVAEPFKRKI